MASKSPIFRPAAVAAALLALASCGSPSSTRDDYYFTEVVFPNGAKIKAEVIRDPLIMQRGMMFRDSLAADRGMLFTHGQPGNFPYWMHNVKVPLDIIWLDSNRNVVEIVHSAAPCPKRPCPDLGGTKPALFVLEVNAGVAKKNNLQAGESLRFIGY